MSNPYKDTKYAKAVVFESGNVRLPAGRLAYPALFEAAEQTKDDGTKTYKYQASLVFPKGTDMKLLNDLVEKAAIDKWGPDYKKKMSVKKPILKVEDFPKMGFDSDEYEFFVRTGTANDKVRPGVKRADMSDVKPEDANEVYAGRWALLTANVYTTAHPKGGNRVSFGLQNAQLLRNDDAIGGRRSDPNDEFEAIDEVADGGSTDDLLG